MLLVYEPLEHTRQLSVNACGAYCPNEHFSHTWALVNSPAWMGIKVISRIEIDNFATPKLQENINMMRHLAIDTERAIG